MQKPVEVLATGVFATALQSLAPAFEAANGTTIRVSIANAGEVAARVVGGEAVDLVMSSSAGVKALAKQGALLPNEIVIGRMRLGVAVRSGAAMPDLTSTETLRALLLSADKIAYIDPNGGGTSGPFFEKMYRFAWRCRCRACQGRALQDRRRHRQGGRIGKRCHRHDAGERDHRRKRCCLRRLSAGRAKPYDGLLSLDCDCVEECESRFRISRVCCRSKRIGSSSPGRLGYRAIAGYAPRQRLNARLSVLGRYRPRGSVRSHKTVFRKRSRHPAGTWPAVVRTSR